MKFDLVMVSVWLAAFAPMAILLLASSSLDGTMSRYLEEHIIARKQKSTDVK
jgi:hypothetical protein